LFEGEVGYWYWKVKGMSIVDGQKMFDWTSHLDCLNFEHKPTCI
jgi:hypothetical protein